MPVLKLFLVLFGNNWRAILLSTVAATTFWFFNALNKNYSTRLNYPLEFSFKRDSVVVVNPLPDVIVVDVSGGGWNLMRKTFLFSAIPVLVEMDNPTEIKFFTRASLLPLITEQLGGIKLDFVVTDTLFINIEEKVEKRLNVLVDSLNIPLRENYRLTSEIRINPDSIEVRGPKSMIDTLKEFYTVKFRQRNIDDDFNDEFDIEFASSLIKPLPDEINVRFNIAEFDRLAIQIPLESTNFPLDSSIYLQDSVIQINYTIRLRDVNKVRSTDFNITADLTMVDQSDSSILPILIAFPTYVMEIELVPESLKVIYAN